MKKRTGPPIADLLANQALITAAVTKAVREALLKHAREGNPVAEGRDGKAVWITPEEILARFSEERTDAASRVD